MKDHKKLISVLYKECGKFANNHNTVDDLVNQIWSMGNVQKVHPAMWRQRIKWDLIDFIRSETGGRFEGTRERRLRIVNPFSLDDYSSNGDEGYSFIHDSLAVYDDQDFEFMEWFNWVLKGLTGRQSLVMKLYYLENMTMKEIAKVIDVSESGVSVYHKKVIERIRDANRVSN